MAMNPQGMCDAIKKEYDNITNSTDWKGGERPKQTAYTEAFDKGLTDYVEKNMEIEYTWDAALPPPASGTDPVKKFSSKLVIENKKIGQPPKVEVWGAMIMECLLKGITEHEEAFITVEKGKLQSASPLIIQLAPGEYPAPLLSECIQIYTWLLACINPTPLAGMHGTFAGATTGMVIK